MIQILNRLGIFLMSIAGLVIGFCFVGFMIFAFALLSPGLLLYYLSIKMGINRLREEMQEQEAQYDENGMKIIDAEYTEEKKDNGMVKKAATRIRDFLNRYAD